MFDDSSAIYDCCDSSGLLFLYSHMEFSVGPCMLNAVHKSITGDRKMTTDNMPITCVGYVVYKCISGSLQSAVEAAGEAAEGHGVSDC